MHSMIFTGAGASAADGAPLQSDLFKALASELRANDDRKLHHSAWSVDQALPSYFSEFFGIDIIRDNLDVVSFPTFEEALGVLELARGCDDSFGNRSYQLGHRPTNYPTIEQIRFILIDSLAQTVAESQRSSKGVHDLLLTNLLACGWLDKIVFATTNYDLFLDNAIAKAAPLLLPNYGFTGSWLTPGTQTGTGPALLKLHGSLGWRYCHSCLSTDLTSEAGNRSNQCSRCGDFHVALIVPPTFVKKMDNATITATRQAFRQCLQDTDHVVFCGYSFPDADMHIKYYFKHREVARRSPLHVTVINEHTNKAASARAEEKTRYERFFCGEVDYTRLSFDQFAADPLRTLAR